MADSVLPSSAIGLGHACAGRASPTRLGRVAEAEGARAERAGADAWVTRAAPGGTFGDVPIKPQTGGKRPHGTQWSAASSMPDRGTSGKQVRRCCACSPYSAHPTHRALFITVCRILALGVAKRMRPLCGPHSLCLASPSRGAGRSLLSFDTRHGKLAPNS